MLALTKSKRERLRVHAEQILEISRKLPQNHWTNVQACDHAKWLLEVLDELDRTERILKRRNKMLGDLKNVETQLEARLRCSGG